MKHTLRSIREAAGVTIVGNVLYLPTSGVSRQTMGKIAKRLSHEAWFNKIRTELGFSKLEASHLNGFVALETLQLARRTSGVFSLHPDEPFKLLDTDQEPAWMAKLPKSAQRYLRIGYATTEGTNPLAIVPQFPYMGFGYLIPDTGMAADAAQVFKLHRLDDIKQLSFLHDPVIKEYDRSSGAMLFEHTRYLHVLDVHAVANLIAANVGVQEDELNTLLTAAISHDTLTPAGGDSVKLVDPAAFDEDLHYPELLQRPEWEEYQAHYGINRELLIKTINGEGLLGRILDLADKSSYLARDVHGYLKSPDLKLDARNPNLYTITSIVREDLNICALWESVVRKNGSLVIRDAERLKRFLCLRALMFKHLYHNPYSRFFEYLVGKGIIKWLYQRGEITRDDLLRETDNWIERKVDDILGRPHSLRLFHNLAHCRIEEHVDIEKARRRATEFDNDENMVVIIDDFNPPRQNGVKKFLTTRGRNVGYFSELYPREAEEIADIMTFPNVVRVYFFSADDLSLTRSSCLNLKKILASIS